MRTVMILSSGLLLLAAAVVFSRLVTLLVLFGLPALAAVLIRWKFA